MNKLPYVLVEKPRAIFHQVLLLDEHGVEVARLLPCIAGEEEWQQVCQLVATAPKLLDACQRVYRAVNWASSSDRLSDDEIAKLLKEVIQQAEGST